jgi:putative flippase GtrA
MAAIVRRLPFGLSRIVAPSLLGFAIINGFTFSMDLGLLSLCHGVLKWPYPAAVTLSYLTAFALSFVLNRAFNFRSHESLGPQTTKYVVAVGINYAAFVLGVGDALTAIGVEYQLARILSGLCEGVYMYCVMRWVVFRGTPRGLRLGAAQRMPGGHAPRITDVDVWGMWHPGPLRDMPTLPAPVPAVGWSSLRRRTCEPSGRAINPAGAQCQELEGLRGAEFPGFAAGRGPRCGWERRWLAARMVTGCGRASAVGLLHDPCPLCRALP